MLKPRRPQAGKAGDTQRERIVAGNLCGESRRNQLLTKRTHVNCEGGEGIDRHMKRLLREGKLELGRVPRGFYNRKLSVLKPTEKGRQHLREQGIDPDSGSKISETRPDYQRWWLVTARMRRVWVGDERMVVHQLRHGKPGETVDPDYDAYLNVPLEAGGPAPNVRLLVTEFRNKAMVYFWCSGPKVGVITADPSNLIKAGRLRKTGNGLVLERYEVFRRRISSQERFSFEGPLVDDLNLLMSYTSDVFTEYHVDGLGNVLYIFCKTPSASVATNLVFDNITLYNPWSTTS